MWRAFWAQNIHFSLEVFVALVAFSAGWIFFDTWLFKKEKKIGLRSVGFFLYALASIIHAAQVEEVFFALPFGIIKASGFEAGYPTSLCDCFGDPFSGNQFPVPPSFWSGDGEAADPCLPRFLAFGSGGGNQLLCSLLYLR